jgi:tRNA dimethylallyltransferase
LALLGPTASGKSEAAVVIAERLGAEIVSVDSMQVYIGMDIGTAKPNSIERRDVPHHMIDLVDPSVEFTVAEFRRMGRATMEASEAPALLITGGSGLHFRSLVDPMSFAPTDPVLRQDLEALSIEELRAELVLADANASEHVDLANPRRVIRALEINRLTGETPSQRATSAEAEKLRRFVPEIEFTAVGIDPGDLLEERVERRLSAMRAGGLVEEVERLRPDIGRVAARAVGYREILAALAGEIEIEEAFRLATANSRRLARKQRTWFQRDPRIRWIPWVDDATARAARALEALG